jgi:glucosamine--fructose-6-phosphate aminotransferase (isomerizing)
MQSALYRTVQRQPEIISNVLAACAPMAEQAAALLRGAKRVILAGTGTSSHAAIVGEHLLRLAGADAYTTTNFDLATYPRNLSPEDAVIEISHRGTKRYGKEVIALAQRSGARVIGLTGQGSPMAGLDVLLQTAPSEESSTHSASYTANLAALALIAARLAAQRGLALPEFERDLKELPEYVGNMLEHEDTIWSVADALAARGRLVLVGAGPNAATAREGALKIKESSYLTAEGFELETLLHGGLQAVETGDIAVVIAAQGPAVSRTWQALDALNLIGARPLLIADVRVAMALSYRAPYLQEWTVTLSPVVEQISPILAVMPLQLLAALTAVLRGTDADSFRADDPVYKRANASYVL